MFFSRDYVFKWVNVEKFGKILRGGVYSSNFAKRAGEKQYQPRDRISDPRYTYWTTQVFNIYPEGDSVGFIVRLPKNVVPGVAVEIPRRVAPREFLGLVVSDRHASLGLDALISQVIEEENKISGFKKLPIYDDGGNLRWPKIINYQEIVRMLAEKHEKRLV